MSFQMPGVHTPDDLNCNYGTSKLAFRGPRKSLDRPFIAFLGGTETYGRFVQEPFVSLVEDGLGVTCVNLGSVNAGLDTLRLDHEVMKIATNAKCVVLQLPEMHALSNRFYRVHARRNDRLIEVMPRLSDLYPELDFTSYNFVQHLVGDLRRTDPKRFEQVRKDLGAAWMRRVSRLVRDCAGRVWLLWLRYDRRGPTAISQRMVQAVGRDACGVIELNVSSAASQDELDTMQFGALQEPIARQLIGGQTHRTIAARLLHVLRKQ